MADYCMKDDGTDFSVFTQIKEDNVNDDLLEQNRDEERRKMDAVEDILLDDFSMGDDSNDENTGGDATVQRSMSIDSIRG
jgi:hypothetical protein